MSANFILLDIGGTDIKTATVSVGSNRLENVRRISFPQFITKNQIIKEVDPEALLTIIKNLLNLELLSTKSFAGILISGQMACWLITDKNYKLISNVVSWQDSRAGEDGPLKINDELKKLNGGEFRPGLPGFGVLHFLKRYNGAYSGSNFETMTSWITRSLCAEGTLSKTHVTDSAPTGLYDIYSREWRPDLLNQALCELRFPQVHDKLEGAGFLKNSEIPIYIPIGDQQASLLGVGINSSRIVVNIGTGGQVAVIVNNPEETQYQVRPFFDGQYISTKTHLPAGRFISRLIVLLQEKYNMKVSYQMLANWNLITADIVAIDKLKPENCEELVSEILENGYSIESTVSIIMKSIAASYLAAIQEIATPEHKEVMFAGGVGQKFANIQEYVCSELKLACKVSPSEETTLQGLANLAKEL
jgi:xylulokinase